jgi:hypothetical protein
LNLDMRPLGLHNRDFRNRSDNALEILKGENYFLTKSCVR